MRGKPPPYPQGLAQYRITPADAGKTPQHPLCRSKVPDHPRGCGENRVTSPMQRGEKGSPPRMRGKLMPPTVSIIIARITPADAGKTFCRRLRRACTRDHPRGCGENDSVAAWIAAAFGSPPRMRGKPTGETYSAYLDRITPADAGKTPQLPPICLSTWDHPRRCGENTFYCAQDIKSIGSPPQVRGKLSPSPYTAAVSRITPAGAGKTRRFHWRCL